MKLAVLGHTGGIKEKGRVSGNRVATSPLDYLIGVSELVEVVDLLGSPVVEMEVQIGELVGLEEPIRNERVKQAQAENVELCSSVPASELEEGRRGGGGAVAIKSLDD